MEIVFWASLLCIYYVFDGYLRALQVLCVLFGKEKVQSAGGGYFP